MYKNIILAVILITALISTTPAASLNLEYTDGYRTTNTTLTESTFINIPAGNIIDSIVYKPTFLTGVPATYNISVRYIVNDIQYHDTYTSKIETSIFHVFTNKYIYSIRHTADSELEYHKDYETYVSKYCWFPIKISSYFGSYSNEDENKITVISEIFGHTGIKRSNDVFSVYDAKAYTPSNITISFTNLIDLDIIVTNKIKGIHTTDYYIGQLNPTLRYTYKLGFSWLDKELYILNIFMITDKLLSIVMFWMSIIAHSFIPILFIILIIGIPFAAFYNSKGRKGFTSNLVIYYGLFFNIILGFIRYVTMMIMRILDVARSLIPWI